MTNMTSAASQPVDGAERRRWVPVAGLVTAAVLLAGCSPGAPTGAGGTDPGGAGSSSAPASSSASAEPAPVTLAATPADGSTGVAVDKRISVKASNGTLSSVTVAGKGTDAKGVAFTDKVKGAIAEDKQSWKASTLLEPGATYTVTMVGRNDQGAQTTTKSTLSTKKLTLKQQTFPTVYPVDGETYGVAMPVVVTFDVAVKDKANFEKHMSVTSSPKQEGSWNWISATEAHYRPKVYWKSGTKVTLKADLNSVSAGNGVYGQESRELGFTVGKSVVTRVNLKSKRATVAVNGETARTIAVSGGKAGFTTRSGQKVITEKLSQTKMRSETVGISKDSPDAYNLDVKYAMRITNTGEFIHAAPWNASKFGVVNASHGCVGMSTADAQWLFNQVRVGDPVIVTGTGRGLEAGNGITDWEVSWSTWKKGSALS